MSNSMNPMNPVKFLFFVVMPVLFFVAFFLMVGYVAGARVATKKAEENLARLKEIDGATMSRLETTVNNLRLEVIQTKEQRTQCWEACNNQMTRLIDLVEQKTGLEVPR